MLAFSDALFAIAMTLLAAGGDCAGLIGLNLIYLLFVAFLPFPTGLLGNYFENALSIVVYAPTVAAVSGMEVVLFGTRSGRLLVLAVPYQAVKERRKPPHADEYL